jgi:hypothetical protein
MVGEAPAHNEATGRDLYASLIDWPPVGPPLSARGEAERERLVLEGRLVAMGGSKASVLTPLLARGDGHRTDLD